MAVQQIRGNTQIKAATITNAEISASAAIALSKLAEAVIQADGGQAFTADQSMGGFKLTNLGLPTAAADAVTKSYADALVANLDLKASVRLATAAALAANTAAGSGIGKTLTADANGALSVDGVAVAVSNRILVKNEATGANNGIYTVTATGDGSNPFVLTRATDADENAEVTSGLFTFVTEGTANDNTGWALITNDPITVDTTALSFTQFSGAGSIIGGAGLTLTGNTLDVVAGNTSITVNANDLVVNASDGLTVSSGLKVLSDATGGANLARAINVSSNGVAVKIDDSTIGEGASNRLFVKNAGITETQLAASVAGDGLTGGAGTALAVGAGTGISVTANAVAVDGTVITDSRFITREVPTGSINGSNTAFTLANTPQAGSEMVFLNGVLQQSGAGNDYTISGSAITYLAAPATGDTLYVSYITD